MSGKSFGAILATAVAAAVARIAMRGGAPDDLVLILVWLGIGGIAIGACVLVWRALRGLLRRIDRALPDRERDRRAELELAYEKAGLERWVQTGSSGDRSLDAKFEAMRAGETGVSDAARRDGATPNAAPMAAGSGQSLVRVSFDGAGDDPRTIALIEALEGDRRETARPRRPATGAPPDPTTELQSRLRTGDPTERGRGGTSRWRWGGAIGIALPFAMALPLLGGEDHLATPSTSDAVALAAPSTPSVSALPDESYAPRAVATMRPARDERIERARAFCREVAEQANAQAYPMRGDAETLIVGGSSADCHVIFENKLINFTRMGDYLLGREGTPLAVAELLPDFKRKIQASCNNPKVNGIFRYGGSLTHKYYDKSGRYVTAVTVTANDCPMP